MEDLALPLNEQLTQPLCETRWFSSDGAVVVRDSIADVFIGGLLLGTFGEDADDRSPRNILAVTLAKSGRLHLGRLASAFGMTDEYLRILRRREEASGLGAVLGVRQGKVSKVSPELRVDRDSRRPTNNGLFVPDQRPLPHANIRLSKAGMSIRL